MAQKYRVFGGGTSIWFIVLIQSSANDSKIFFSVVSCSTIIRFSRLLDIGICILFEL